MFFISMDRLCFKGNGIVFIIPPKSIKWQVSTGMGGNFAPE